MGKRRQGAGRNKEVSAFTVLVQHCTVARACVRGCRTRVRLCGVMDPAGIMRGVNPRERTGGGGEEVGRWGSPSATASETLVHAGMVDMAHQCVV